MTTVAGIAAEVFDEIAQEFTDGVIQTAQLDYVTQGPHNVATGKSLDTPVSIAGGRGFVGTPSALAKAFPAYVAGPLDTLVYLEGFTAVPQVGWTVKLTNPVTLTEVTRTITEVGDIVGVGSFFEVVAA